MQATSMHAASKATAQGTKIAPGLCDLSQQTNHKAPTQIMEGGGAMAASLAILEFRSVLCARAERSHACKESHLVYVLHSYT